VANQLAIENRRREEEADARRIRSIASEGSFVDSARGNFSNDYLYSHAKSEMSHVASLSSAIAAIAASAYQLPVVDPDSKPLTPEEIFASIPQDSAAEAAAWAAGAHALAATTARSLLHYRHMKTATRGGGTSFDHVQQIEYQKAMDKEELELDKDHKHHTAYDDLLKAAAEAIAKKVPGNICPALAGGNPRQGATAAGAESTATTPQKSSDRGGRDPAAPRGKGRGTPNKSRDGYKSNYNRNNDRGPRPFTKDFDDRRDSRDYYNDKGYNKNFSRDRQGDNPDRRP
jgi:hypothetical protein